MTEAKLIPRLVPSPLWGKNLRSDLGRARWSKISSELRRLTSNQCEICGGQSEGAPTPWKTCLDEVWAYDYDFLTAYLSDLKVICWWCNSIIHFGFTISTVKDKALLRKVLEHGQRLNGLMTSEHMRSICEVHLDHHRAVSAHKSWTIDWDDWEAVLAEARARLLAHKS